MKPHAGQRDRVGKSGKSHGKARGSVAIGTRARRRKMLPAAATQKRSALCGAPFDLLKSAEPNYLSSAKYLMVRTIWLVYEFSLSYQETTFTSVVPSPMGMHLVCVPSNREP